MDSRQRDWVLGTSGGGMGFSGFATIWKMTRG